MRAACMVLMFAVTTARAETRCVEGPPPAPRKVNANNGLPTLGAMVMAGGGGMALLAMFSGIIGGVGAFEIADSRSEILPLLGAVAVMTTALSAAAALTLLSGAAIWFIAWLPPITDTRVRCPPRDENHGPT